MYAREIQIPCSIINSIRKHRIPELLLATPRRCANGRTEHLPWTVRACLSKQYTWRHAPPTRYRARPHVAASITRCASRGYSIFVISSTSPRRRAMTCPSRTVQRRRRGTGTRPAWARRVRQGIQFEPVDRLSTRRERIARRVMRGSSRSRRRRGREAGVCRLGVATLRFGRREGE